jgi:acyl carrier protein
VLQKRGANEPSARPGSASEVPSLDALRTALTAGNELVRARGLANDRLVREVASVALIRSGHRDQTVGALREELAKLPSGFDPDTVERLAREAGAHDVALSWAQSGALDQLDVSAARAGTLADADASSLKDVPLEAHANRPVRVQGGDALPPELRAFLRERLPEFMVPSAFVLLEAFPLTPNGKIDRKALPEPERVHRSSTEVYAAPSSELELKIAAVWQGLLGLDSIGIRDNFFDLGANSFLMVQASGKLRDALGTPISLVDLFQYPSVGALASRLGDPAPEDQAAQEGKDRAQARADAMQKRRGARARGR